MPAALHSTHAQIIEAAALALALLAVTTAFHYEALRILLHRVFGRPISPAQVVRLLAALVTIHLAEVGIYAGAYALGTNVLTLGRLQGATHSAMVDFCYFAAETYSTLGYGDLVPTGALRLLASVEALNGVLMLSLSGAFLFGMMREGFRREIDRLEGDGGITGGAPHGPFHQMRRGAQLSLHSGVIKASGRQCSRNKGMPPIIRP